MFLVNQNSATQCYRCDTMSTDNCADPFYANGVTTNECDGKCFVCIFNYFKRLVDRKYIER